MFDFSPDAVLMVLASELYDESDYIRNYDEFLEFVKKVKILQQRSVDYESTICKFQTYGKRIR